MIIEIREDLALRLQALAERDGADLDNMVHRTLMDLVSQREKDGRRYATLADMARHAKELNMASPQPSNTAERSREILNTEFVDYLKSRPRHGEVLQWLP